MAHTDEGFFRQSMPPIGLSIERQTPTVPADGWYYVVLRGVVEGRFRQKAQAVVLYKALLAESGYTPPKVKLSEGNEMVANRPGEPGGSKLRQEKEDVILFANDDAKYEAWVHRHHDGFVLNTWPPPALGGRTKDQMMHKAHCGHIATDFDKLNYTGKGRPKLCGVSIDQLLAAGRARGRVAPCPDCDPY